MSEKDKQKINYKISRIHSMSQEKLQQLIQMLTEQIENQIKIFKNQNGQPIT